MTGPAAEAAMSGQVKIRPGYGDCFPAAIVAATVVEEEGATNVRVCHGLPIGTGPENLGRRFWHAWVEFTTDRGPTVLDASNGRRIVAKRAAWYRLGQIDPEQVWRYTTAEAEAMSAEWGTYGPWVEGYEEMGA